MRESSCTQLVCCRFSCQLSCKCGHAIRMLSSYELSISREDGLDHETGTLFLCSC